MRTEGALRRRRPRRSSEMVAFTPWTDANQNFVPDCDLLTKAANGECAAMANQNFGTPVQGTLFDPTMMNGWRKRGYNWEFGSGVQHELMPRTTLEFGYYRRWFGNF